MFQILTQRHTSAVPASQSWLESGKSTAGFCNEVAHDQISPNFKTSITIKNENGLNLRPQLQLLTLDCWQYAAFANWVKEEKPDMSAADNRLTALASRSLSATSEIPGSGIAPTGVKRIVVARKRIEANEKKVDSILDGYLERGNERNNEGWVRKMNVTIGDKGRPCQYLSCA